MRFRRRHRIVGAIACALVVAALGVALAGGGRVFDPDDTSGVFDVREVGFSHPLGQPPAWTVITASSWKVNPLWDRGYIFLEFDTKGYEDAEHYVVIRSDGRRMHADLFKVATRAGNPDAHLRALTVWRKSDRSVSVKVPLKLMSFPAQRTYYRWWVVTTLTGDKCPHTCIDRVPDEGSIRQWRPGMSPSASQVSGAPGS